ncbi:unnamed protein product [Diplocarpon coronariae]
MALPEPLETKARVSSRMQPSRPNASSKPRIHAMQASGQPMERQTLMAAGGQFGERRNHPIFLQTTTEYPAEAKFATAADKSR